MYDYNAKVLRVVDGDTVEALIDLGFRTHHKGMVRLYGIDTPEIRTRDLEEKERGYKAKDRLTELLEACDYQIVLISHGLDKYGRALGTLKNPEGVDLNQQLLLEGFAEPYE